MHMGCETSPNADISNSKWREQSPDHGADMMQMHRGTGHRIANGTRPTVPAPVRRVEQHAPARLAQRCVRCACVRFEPGNGNTIVGSKVKTFRAPAARLMSDVFFRRQRPRNGSSACVAHTDSCLPLSGKKRKMTITFEHRGEMFTAYYGEAWRGGYGLTRLEISETRLSKDALGHARPAKEHQPASEA
eukprot:gene8384-biopygen9158